MHEAHNLYFIPRPRLNAQEAIFASGFPTFDLFLPAPQQAIANTIETKVKVCIKRQGEQEVRRQENRRRFIPVST
jgi:hypothetical protein